MWQAQVWVKWNDKAPKANDWNWFKEWTEVNAAWSVMGDWDMLLTISAKTPGDVENFIWNKLRKKIGSPTRTQLGQNKCGIIPFNPLAP
jgi:hypothetical protein